MFHILLMLALIPLALIGLAIVLFGAWMALCVISSPFVALWKWQVRSREATQLRAIKDPVAWIFGLLLVSLGLAAVGLVGAYR